MPTGAAAGAAMAASASAASTASAALRCRHALQYVAMYEASVPCPFRSLHARCASAVARGARAAFLFSNSQPSAGRDGVVFGAGDGVVAPHGIVRHDGVQVQVPSIEATFVGEMAGEW